MSQESGTYHRLGQPGGPGCPLAVLPITISGPDGSPVPSTLLDGGTESTEIELLRTIASRFGVKWGHDDFGWWAVARTRDFPSWAVWRQDDSGSKFLIEANLSEAQAQAMVKDFEAKGHKQTYWCNNEQNA